MRKILRFGFIFLATTLPFSLWSQDSIPTIFGDTAYVTASLQQEQIGSSIIHSKSILAHQSVGLHLTQKTAIAFKSYGAGMLMTPTTRGTGAAHTSVFWNGLPLQSVMNGVTDFSLMYHADDIQLIPGGNSPMTGSGAIGGLIHLNSRFGKTGWQGNAGIGFGSFGHYLADLAVAYQSTPNGKNKTIWATKTEYLVGKQKNDFPFKNSSKINQPIENQTNNNNRYQHIKQSILAKINRKNTFKAFFWQGQTYREIPPSMTATHQNDRQTDGHSRLIGHWQFSPMTTWDLETKIGLNNEFIHFQNNGLDDFSAASTVFFDGRFRKKNPTGHWLAGWTTSIQKAISSGYEQDPHRNQHGLSLAWVNNWFDKKWASSIQLRQEWLDEAAVPFIFSIGLTANVHPKWTLRTKGGRHFRAPTFNDIFWKEIGNPDLLPETGYQAEFGLDYAHKNLKIGVTGFWSSIQDWILWAPNATGIWQPKNQKTVQSNGIETNLHYQLQAKDFNMSWDLQYTVLQSYNKDIYSGSIGLSKQLIYTPQHKGTIQWATQYQQSVSLDYVHALTGKRYYQENNIGQLPAYHTGDIHLTYTPWGKNQKGQFQLQINNIWQRDYQVIRFIPMPGRSFVGKVIWVFGN